MTVSNIYSQHTNSKKKTSRYRAIRSLLLCFVLFFALSAFGQDSPPSFVNGPSQAILGCDNVTGASAGISLNSYLTASDADTGQVETWAVFASPLFGTLTGFPTSDSSNGGVVTPSGLSYIPDTGFVGTDSFTVYVTDGTFSAYTTITVQVNPLPTLSSTHSPGAICDGTTFYYAPTSATGGATFTWHRGYTLSITPTSAESGVGDVLETLGNTTFYDVPVTYVYKVSAHGCTGNPEDVVVVVKPTPALATTLYDTVCSGAPVNYMPASLTTGTTYTWSRASVSGISPDTSLGAGTLITEALTNTASAQVTTVYIVVLTANGCTNAQNLNVTVDPPPAATLTTITTEPSSSLCAGTLYQNFGASIAPPSGTTYSWTVVNAVISATGSDGQFILVNFPNAGNASVILSYSQAGTQCAVSSVSNVTVGAGPSPSGYVLYNNAQFVYTDNTVDSYQWGYDNTSTLDSTIIAGATFQSYVNATPDYADNYYWVLTTKDGCMQKTYFNAPTAITNISSGNAGLKLYPNPTTNTLNIDLVNIQGSAATIAVTDMMGQTVIKQSVTTSSANIDVTNLPAGCYIVNCTQNGMKLGAERFIKN